MFHEVPLPCPPPPRSCGPWYLLTRAPFSNILFLCMYFSCFLDTDISRQRAGHRKVYGHVLQALHYRIASRNCGHCCISWMQTSFPAVSTLRLSILSTMQIRYLFYKSIQASALLPDNAEHDTDYAGANPAFYMHFEKAASIKCS